MGADAHPGDRGHMDCSSVGTAPASTMRRLLIVAEDSLIVEAIRIGFRKSGEFNLIGHVSPHRPGVDVIFEAQPDVVLVDDIDGGDRTLELVSDLSHQTEYLTVMVLSIRMDDERLNQLLDAGASTVISKASPPAAIAMLVRETLNGHIVHKLAPSASQLRASSSSSGSNESSLTGRELEILHLVAGGCTNGDIARRLWVTEQTVKFHLRNIYRKLGVANRTQASHFAHVNGLVDLQPVSYTAPHPEVSAVAS